MNYFSTSSTSDGTASAQPINHVDTHVQASRSAGAIVIDPWTNNNMYDPLSFGILTVKQRAGQIWGLPKGHVDEGETLLAGARRELHEESGLDLDALVEGRDYAAFRLQDRNVHKHANQVSIKRIHFFVFVMLRKSTTLRLVPKDVNEVSHVAWFTMQQLKLIPLDDPSFKRNRTLSPPAVSTISRICHRLCNSEQMAGIIDAMRQQQVYRPPTCGSPWASLAARNRRRTVPDRSSNVRDSGDSGHAPNLPTAVDIAWG
jgi:ADP-ribose pyrophosphatase YjhB (NUDIX family)